MIGDRSGAEQRQMQDEAGDAEHDPVDEIDAEDPDPSAEVEPGGGQLVAARPCVLEGQHQPTGGRYPADDRDDQDQALNGDLAQPGRVFESPPEGIADAVHERILTGDGQVGQMALTAADCGLPL